MTVIYCTIVVDNQRDQTTAPVVEIIGRHHNTVAGPNNAQPLERTLTSIAAFMRLFFLLRRSNTICKEMKPKLRRRRRQPVPISGRL